MQLFTVHRAQDYTYLTDLNVQLGASLRGIKSITLEANFVTIIQTTHNTKH